jgi:hypothetical protein
MAGPVLVLVLRYLTAAQLRLVGSASTSAGVVGLLVFIGWDLTRWLGAVPPEFHRYAFQRILFAIGTNPDVPLVQVLVAGAVCWIVGIVRKRRKDSAPTRARSDGGTHEYRDVQPRSVKGTPRNNTSPLQIEQGEHHEWQP